MKTLAVPIAAFVLMTTPATAQEAPGSAQIAPPSCDYGSPHPDAPEELAQFDFLIGDFAITVFRWVEGQWQEVPFSQYGPARWNGRYALGGMAIADEWYDRDPGLDPAAPRGINIRMWDDEAQEWDMTWLYTGNHQGTDLRARIEDGRLTMWQVYPERPDFRAYFERYSPDSWARIALAPDAEGNWHKTIKLQATRIACPAEIVFSPPARN